jgi:hypothetical protein
MSKIIDNSVENGFMQTMAKTIEEESDSKPLEQDFNMNQKLVNYLKDKYEGRTVTGITENKMKKLELKQLIKEEIYKIFEEEEDAQVTGQIRVDLFDKLNIPNFKVFDEISSIAKKNGFEVPKSLTFKTFSTINGREISTVSDALSNLKTIKKTKPALKKK